MTNFEYQHIEFIDGSNPYICTTKKEFKKMKEKYIMENIGKNMWKATFKINYSVVGFKDKNKIATFFKTYQTKSSAMRVINKAIKENTFEQIVLRREEKYLKNSDDLEISSSTPIKIFG